MAATEENKKQKIRTKECHFTDKQYKDRYLFFVAVWLGVEFIPRLGLLGGVLLLIFSKL